MLEILYRDEHLVAINKPSGLLVHRSLIDRHETRFAIQLTRDQIGQKVYPVHRLDKPTSGVLLFALDSDTARLLTEQFTAGQVQKTYLAVVRGHTAEQGVIDYPLTEELDKIADANADQHKPAQAAISHYCRVMTFELPYAVDRYPTSRYSLLELCPKTGRKHQLRRHLKHISHHLIGDTTHGNGKHNRFFREQWDCQRLLLHAASVVFTHPYTHEAITVNAMPPEDFSKVVRLLLPFRQPSINSVLLPRGFYGKAFTIDNGANS
ncbi:MAG: tRNA pseudouridine(65) synthase TruC [Candidatus Thiothrix putei]|uniref:tRNA pseudouridine synthase C n=1 Tax=Candidatus Thiothrix putei TaxID=3080811 RepID=A0AA95KR19_9GAMM|nr:MAG: tRNA pseudouridine(65) synthase TruC [Candidatus Thiothrix putei]